MSIQHANRGIVKKDLQLYYNREFNGSFLGESTVNFFSIPAYFLQKEGNHSTSFSTSTTNGIPDLVVPGNKQVYYAPEYITLVATGAWVAESNRLIIYPRRDASGGANSYNPSGTYRISFYARVISGNTALGFAFYGNSINNTATLTTKWQRFNANSSHGGAMIIEFGNLNAGSMVCQIACIQVEAKSYATPFTLPVLWSPNLVNVTSTSGHTTMTKTGGSDLTWNNARVYSSEGYSVPCYISFKSSQINKYIAIGLNSDPSTGINYTNIDYAFIPRDNGFAGIYENGTDRSIETAYTTSTIFEIIYDGVNINYYMDGVLKRTVARTGSGPLYLDSSFYGLNGVINSLSFGPLLQINRFSNYAIGGGGLLDISGNNVNANLTNVSFDSNGYYFDGSASYINLGTSKTSLNISSDLTVEAVIKLTSNFTLNPTIIGNGYWQEVYPYKLQFEYNSNNGNLGLFRYDGTNYRYALWNFGSQNTYFLNKTVHIVATYSSLTNTFAIYYNGVSQTITSSNPGNISVNNTTNFAIGAQIKTDGTKGDYFPGTINLVRVYNRALTASEVLQNFNATRKTYGI
jgi:hypothetical protein